jgi:hypothetical protein
MRSLGKIKITCLGHMHLLHVVVLLHLVSVVIKILLTPSHLLLVESRINSNLVAENRLVLPMLDTHFLILVISHLY